MVFQNCAELIQVSVFHFFLLETLKKGFYINNKKQLKLTKINSYSLSSGNKQNVKLALEIMFSQCSKAV